MSDTDRDVLALLDQAVASTPPLHLDREEVVARGEQLVRRRRASRAGMAFGGLALAGAVWLGAGVGGGGLPGPEVTPAGVAWEVEEPSAVALPDGLEYVGHVQPRTLSRTATSSSATFVADGVEETVEGRTLPGGVELFLGTRATVAVWDHPRGASPNMVVRPESQDTGGAAVVTVDGQELVYWTTDEAGFVPEEVIFHDEDSLWTASGKVAETAELSDDGLTVTAVALEELELTGYLDGNSFHEVDTLTVLSVELPWWRGGDHVVATVARLPREAVFAREVLREEVGGEPRGISAPRPTSLVGSSSMVLFASDWAGDGTGSKDMVYGVQWSTDGETWQDQDQDQEHESGPVSPPPPGTVGPGGEVSLLGESYRVATDAHGWPRLVAEDGSDFLTVSDDMGPSEGGVVMWREHWWPWSDRNEVHFVVDGRPVVSPPADVQDAVTISGPAGVVGVAAATSSS